MILDHVSHADTYASLGSRFALALEFLKRADLKDLPVGTYRVDGDNVYVMIQEIDLKDAGAGKWESHFRYADIQMPLCGRESIGFAPAEGAKVLIPCPEGKDVQFLDVISDRACTLEEGEMMILFPQDAHKPGIAPSQNERHVKKAVAKVLLDR